MHSVAYNDKKKSVMLPPIAVGLNHNMPASVKTTMHIVAYLKKNNLIKHLNFSLLLTAFYNYVYGIYKHLRTNLSGFTIFRTVSLYQNSGNIKV